MHSDKVKTSSRRCNWFKVAAVAACSLLLAACAGNSSTGTQGSKSSKTKSPFVFGAVLSLTGAISAAGLDTKAGLEAAIQQINSEGGILGRHVKFVYLDSASQPAQALLAAKRLISSDHANFIYADIYSTDAFAIEPYTTSIKYFTITDGATPSLGNPQKFPYAFEYFDAAPRRGQAVAGAVSHVVSTEHLSNNVGILTDSDPAEIAVGNEVKAELSKLSLHLSSDISFSGNPTDLSSQLEHLRSSGAGIVQVDSASSNTTKAVMTGMETLGWKAPVVFDPTALHGNLLAQVPTAVRSQFFAVDYASASRQGTTVPPNYQAFVSALHKYGDTSIAGLGFAESASAIAFLAQWTFDHAQAKYGNTSVESLTKTLSSIGKTSYSASGSFGRLFLANPGYTPQVHNTLNAKSYTHFWALVRASSNVDGTYKGTPFTLPSALAG